MVNGGTQHAQGEPTGAKALDWTRAAGGLPPAATRTVPPAEGRNKDDAYFFLAFSGLYLSFQILLTQADVSPQRGTPERESKKSRSSRQGAQGRGEGGEKERDDGAEHPVRR